jgi:hypothetical protein
MKKRRARPEQDLQKAVVQHLRVRAAPGCVWFHVPNQGTIGGRHAARIGGILKGMGVRPGVADLILLHKGTFFALELKAEFGRTSEQQLKFLQDVNAADGFAAVAEGLDAALKSLEMWGCLRGKAA